MGTSRELVHDLLCLCEHAQGVLQLFLQFGIIVIITFNVANNIFVLGVISTVLSLRGLFLSFLALLILRSHLHEKRGDRWDSRHVLLLKPRVVALDRLLFRRVAYFPQLFRFCSAWTASLFTERLRVTRRAVSGLRSLVAALHLLLLVNFARFLAFFLALILALHHALELCLERVDLFVLLLYGLRRNFLGLLLRGIQPGVQPTLELQQVELFVWQARRLLEQFV